MTDVSEQPVPDESGGAGTSHLGGFTFMDGIGGKIESGSVKGEVTGAEQPGGPQVTKATTAQQGNFLPIETPLFDITEVSVRWQYTPAGEQSFGEPQGSAQMGAMGPGMNNLTLNVGEEPSGNPPPDFTVTTDWQQSP